MKRAGPLVAIGSRNPAKTKGVRSVFPPFFPGCTFAEVDTSAVVRAQPIGMRQVLSGARRRARFAIAECSGDFGVGVEAGLLSITAREHINLQIAVIVDAEGRSGTGFSCGFLIPDRYVERIRKGEGELDRYSHELTGAERITEEEGIVYHVTGGMVSRLQMTEQCVGMALVPWLNRKVYGL